MAGIAWRLRVWANTHVYRTITIAHPVTVCRCMQISVCLSVLMTPLQHPQSMSFAQLHRIELMPSCRVDISMS